MKNSLSRLNPYFLTAVPVLVFVLAIVLRAAAGPFWLGPNSDPSYLYLINSLYFADHLTPYFTDHPGTTLQILGSVILQGMNVFLPPEGLAANVIENPELFLNGLYWTLLPVFVGSVFFLGYYTYRKTESILAAVLMQMPAFLLLTLKSYRGGTVLPILANVFPETLLITICNLYAVGCIKLFFDQSIKDFRITGVYLGAVCALGLATKVTFLPLIIVPLILLKDVRSRLVFTGALIASWVVVTLPIMPRYADMFAWLGGILTHLEFHGSGESGVVNIPQLFNALQWVAGENIFFCLFWVVCLGVLINRLVVTRRFSHRTKWLGVVLLTAGVHALMVARQPAPQYFVPAISLLGLLAFCLYRLCPEGERVNQAALVLIIIFGASNTAWAMQYQAKLKEKNHGILEFSQHVDEQYQDCTIAGFYRSSSVPFALNFGDVFGPYTRYSKIMQKKYPEAVYWNRWDFKFHHFKDGYYAQTLLRNNPCLVLYGGYNTFENCYVKVKELESNSGEFLYQVTDITAEDARKHYLVAKRLQMEGKYRKAYAHALLAQKYGFPGVSEYVQELKNRLEPSPGVD